MQIDRSKILQGILRKPFPKQKLPVDSLHAVFSVLSYLQIKFHIQEAVSALNDIKQADSQNHLKSPPQEGQVS